MEIIVTVLMAILSYGAVAVPILHEFKADNIRHINQLK